MKPALAIPCCASGFFMKVSHTKLVRRFSAMIMVRRKAELSPAGIDRGACTATAGSIA